MAHLKQPSIPRWKFGLLILLALGMVACFILMTGLDHFTRQAYTYLWYFGVAFGLYLLAVILVWQVELTNRRPLLVAFFAAALLMRIPLWFTEPTLSTDVWRYLWDARLLNQGVNPYADRVDSPDLDPLETSFRSRVQHQWMASPYPPAAQLTFSGVYGLFPNSPTAMQVVFSLFDLAAGAVLIILLQRLKLPTGRAALYLWSPLIIVEFSHSAHVDSLVTLLVLLTLLWTIAGLQTASMVALALATLTKFIPILLLPPLIRRWGWRRTIAYIAMVMLGFLPFIGAGLGLTSASEGTGIFGAARIYSLIWKTNDGLFYWLVEGLRIAGFGQPIGLAKVIAAIVLATVTLWIWRRSGDEQSKPNETIITGTVLLISAYTLLSAAVFPWYLSWLLALLPLLPVSNRKGWWPFLIGWIYFSGAVNLSYLFYLDPANPRELVWVRRLEYWPLFLLLFIGLTLHFWDRGSRQPQSIATLPDTNP